MGNLRHGGSRKWFLKGKGEANIEDGSGCQADGLEKGILFHLRTAPHPINGGTFVMGPLLMGPFSYGSSLYGIFLCGEVVLGQGILPLRGMRTAIETSVFHPCCACSETGLSKSDSGKSPGVGGAKIHVCLVSPCPWFNPQPCIGSTGHYWVFPKYLEKKKKMGGCRKSCHWSLVCSWVPLST